MLLWICFKAKLFSQRLHSFLFLTFPYFHNKIPFSLFWGTNPQTNGEKLESTKTLIHPIPETLHCLYPEEYCTETLYKMWLRGHLHCWAYLWVSEDERLNHLATCIVYCSMCKACPYCSYSLLLRNMHHSFSSFPISFSLCRQSFDMNPHINSCGYVARSLLAGWARKKCPGKGLYA